MTSNTNTITDRDGRTEHDGRTDLAGRTEHGRLTETKASTKTTEFFVYIAAVLGVAITAFLVSGDVATNTVDPFTALDALSLISFLTIGYMIARGLAKSGTRTNA